MKDNKLIAEFMDYTHVLLPVSVGLEYYDNDEMKYHTEWNWLMPVVEKIDDLFGVDFQVDDAINRVHNAVLSFDIDNTYQAVVEFINEYNNE